MNLKDHTNQHNQKEVLKIIVFLLKLSTTKKDKLLKTETYPLIHFLEGFENEFKRVRYN